MNQALYAAVSGASNQRMRLDVLTNNLANVNTAGFKEDKLYFHIPDNEEDPRMLHKINGFVMSPPAQPYETRTDFSPSTLKHTNNVLDFAIKGQGFFCIQTPEGKQYTRRGDFSLSETGALITKDGHQVLGKNGEIVIQGKKITVSEEGQITADGVPVDTLKVVGIDNPQMLKKIGGTRFAFPNDKGGERELEQIQVKQGFLENSGVNPVKTMTQMIDVLRGYESYQKVVHFLNEIAKKNINEVGKLA